MATAWSENFEGSGYENVGDWTEAATNPPNDDCDEDHAGPGSLPLNGGEQCLAIIRSSGGGLLPSDTFDDGGSVTDAYTRFYIYIPSALTFANNSWIQIALFLDESTDFVDMYLYRNSGGTAEYFQFKGKASGGAYDSVRQSAAISRDTWYCVECNYDGGGGGYEFRLNGAIVGTAGGTSLTTATHKWRFLFSPTGASYGTIYFDYIKVDNATWVGPEAAPGPSKPIMMKYYRSRRTA